MKVRELEIKGVYEILLEPFKDERGAFMRTFDVEKFESMNLPSLWVQENYSLNNQKGVLRGLHFIFPPYSDGKLIRCTKGRIWDVAVDLRKNSDTIGKHLVTDLSEDDHKWIYIPKGFAHGFCTLTEKSAMIYKHDTFYYKHADSGIRWDDPDINIKWPVENPIISEKDKRLMSFSEFLQKHQGL